MKAGIMNLEYEKGLAVPINFKGEGRRKKWGQKCRDIQLEKTKGDEK